MKLGCKIFYSIFTFTLFYRNKWSRDGDALKANRLLKYIATCVDLVYIA